MREDRLTSDNRELAQHVLSWWLLGNLAHADWIDLMLPALALGDETAAILGVELAQFRRRLFVIASLITGVMVAVSGAIGFDESRPIPVALLICNLERK